MLRSRLLILKFIHPLSRYDIGEIFNLFTIGYEEEKGFGFVNSNMFDDVIDSILIYRANILQRTFNPTNGTFAIQEQPSYYQVPFRIDYHQELLQVHAGGERLQKLISILGYLFQYKVSIGDILINFNSFQSNIDKINLLYRIIGATINRYQPEIGISGRFSASFDEQANAKNFLNSNMNELTEILIEIFDEDTKVLWRLTSLGKVIIRSEEDQFERQLKNITTLILEEKNG
jgi:hypothetical protein